MKYYIYNITMLKHKGSNIVEYVIPLVLIGLVVGLGIYYIFSSGGLQNFYLSSNKSRISANNTMQIGEKLAEDKLINMQNIPGFLGGTPDNPKKQCDGEVCTIDYGTFILEGLPANFNEFVQTAGVSGGTDKLAELLKQIASQVNSQGNEELANDILNLANLGHNISLLQNNVEDIINVCNNEITCARSYDKLYIAKPEGYNEFYTPFKVGTNYSEAARAGCIGQSRYDYYKKPEEFQKYLNQNKIDYVYIDLYEKIINSPGLSNEIKGVIEELSYDISIIGDDFQNNASFIMIEDRETNTYYDFLKLTDEDVLKPDETELFNNINTYNASKITNYDSALICSAGWNKDTGSSCH
ncbi:MAG: hypothetical protein AB1782_07770 [Cyanobacteriota bacterium]